MRRFPSVVAKRSHGLRAPLQIVLTSYPPRFADLALTIRSLLDQTVAADRIALWVAREDRGSIPAEVEMLRQHGLEILTCKDLRSYKKLIPSLRDSPSAYHVTADDDVYYPPSWLDSLVSVAGVRQSSVVAARAHLARTWADGTLKPYADWQLATDELQARDERTRLFPTGVGGILYPPNAFAYEVFNEAAFFELCPFGDDVWFFWMTRLAGVEQVRARDWFDVVEWPRSQRVALANENLHNNRNDVYIRAMEMRYGLIP